MTLAQARKGEGGLLRYHRERGVEEKESGREAPGGNGWRRMVAGGGRGNSTKARRLAAQRCRHDGALGRNTIDARKTSLKCA